MENGERTFKIFTGFLREGWGKNKRLDFSLFFYTKKRYISTKADIFGHPKKEKVH